MDVYQSIMAGPDEAVSYALAFVNYPPADVLYYDAFLAPEMDEEEEWFDN